MRCFLPQFSDRESCYHTVRSLNRALDDKLYLVVKQEGKEGYNFPQGPVETSQTMREAVESLLDGLDIYAIGNAPTGHVGQGDQTIFFHRVEYLGKDDAPEIDGAEDYLWLTKDELVEMMQPAWRPVLKDMC